MYYVPVIDSYYRLPSAYSYIPVYSTSTKRISSEETKDKSSGELRRIQRELADLRDDLKYLRSQKETCRICSSATRTIQCDESCSICYPHTLLREREESYSRALSPVHYCSICHDYVIDQEYPPPSPSPRPYRSITGKKSVDDKENRLSEYLSRQIDLQRLQPRYIPEERPIWVPTAYKHDYPHRRWVTRQSNFF